MTAPIEERLDAARLHFRRLAEELERCFLGQARVVEELCFTLLAGGHALLEGAPGLGKTTLVRAMATALGLDFRRIQFTPDLMPPDIVGTRILEEDDAGRRRFSFERGPIFAQVVLADEINRATPRTQSALLEAMQEQQVTVFGETLPLDDPFFVIATQNPLEMEGTYPLPEAQLDRFLLKILIAAPDLEGLIGILEATTGEAVAQPRSVIGLAEVRELRCLVRGLPASSAALELAARTVLATQPDAPLAPDSVRRYVRYGASPRGGQAMLLAAKARALVSGRLHVSGEDLEIVAAPALRHRLILGYEGEASGVDPDSIVAEAFQAARRGMRLQ
jgi:MoxR-like ATPase